MHNVNKNILFRSFFYVLHKKYFIFSYNLPIAIRKKICYTISAKEVQANGLINSEIKPDAEASVI
jgi:hypothetical protein